MAIQSLARIWVLVLLVSTEDEAHCHNGIVVIVIRLCGSTITHVTVIGDVIIHISVNLARVLTELLEAASRARFDGRGTRLVRRIPATSVACARGPEESGREQSEWRSREAARPPESPEGASGNGMDSSASVPSVQTAWPWSAALEEKDIIQL
ncbi:hypothetical protein EDB89DRAFT_1905034 [Lactarius sanguifluus]|nr:hypothetical protein EDB89DRAFT_1905034 [Lactarius sanguifluus]